MGIRDTSFWNWETVDIISSEAAFGERVAHSTSAYYDIAFDSTGSIYVVGKIKGQVQKTEFYNLADQSSLPDTGYWLVKKSIDGGDTWQVVDFFPNGNRSEGGAASIEIDPNDVIYVGGSEDREQISVLTPTAATQGPYFGIRRSIDRGESWETVYSTGSDDFQVQNHRGACRALHYAPLQRNTDGIDGRIFAGGGMGATRVDFLAVSSQTGASGTWVEEMQEFLFAGVDNTVLGITSPPSSSDINAAGDSYTGSIYLTTDSNGVSTMMWNVRSGSADLGSESTWEYLQGFGKPAPADVIFNGVNDSWYKDEVNEKLWYTANQGDDQFDFMAKSSTNKINSITQFTTVLTQSDTSFWTSDPMLTHTTQEERQFMDIAENGDIYFCHFSGSQQALYVKKSSDGGATFESFDNFLPEGQSRTAPEEGVYPYRMRLNKVKPVNKFGNPEVWVVGRIGAGDSVSSKRGFIRKGILTANSASLGPRSLVTSFGYVRLEESGNTTHAFKLNNISEFPHSNGLFQMRNMVLGTTDSGKIGKTDDSIIQVKHFGSVVRVLWPSQAGVTIPIRGYGDFSIGERSGKLNTNFVFGDEYNVEEFDHLALYCALRKQISGTLDNVEIRVERRPLKSTGFSIDQSIEYETSGSVTVAKLRDLVYKKEIDYGDLTIREISYPIDVPLNNVKEIRISARHTAGQIAEENKNFLIYGRLIKSAEET